MESRRSVLYVCRNLPGVYHSQRIDLSPEADTIDVIETAMEYHGRDVEKEFAIYTGYAKNNLMTIEQQFQLFWSADIIISAHGGTFANVLWMGIRYSSNASPPSAVMELENTVIL